MIDENGTYDISESEYHRDPAVQPSLSCGLAKLLITKSPLHAWTNSQRLNPNYRPIERDAFDLGRAFHTAMLGKGAPIEVIDSDSWASKTAREQRDLARLAGRTPMLAAQFETLGAMIGAARHQLLDGFGISLDKRHRNELAAVARGSVDEVWCRALIDHAPDDAREPLLDLKTCEDASPEACVKAVASYEYALQAAHYCDVWFAATGERRGFRFAFIEKSPPFAVSVVELYDAEGDDADWMLAARDKAATARRIWRRCIETDTWPGYPAAVAVLGAPGWYSAKWEIERAAQVSE